MHQIKIDIGAVPNLTQRRWSRGDAKSKAIQKMIINQYVGKL
jgi:hypothetical protein